MCDKLCRLSRCLITKKGCASLASALRSNPSYLRELDLSYNIPGDSGVKQLSAGLENPHWRLEKLKYVERVCEVCVNWTILVQVSWVSYNYLISGTTSTPPRPPVLYKTRQRCALGPCGCLHVVR